MTAILVLSLLAVAIGIAWWALQRSARWRRESEQREAKVLEAILAARAGGAADVDLDRVLGAPRADAASSRDDAVLRAAELAASIAGRPAADMAAASPVAARAVTAHHVDAGTAADGVVVVVGSAVGNDSEPGPDAPAAVRDLVQVFYEARGFRPNSVEASAQPVEAVLAHKSDAKRSYAFVPLRGAPSAAELAAIAQAARRIGQARALVATEAPLPAGAPEGPVGVRVYDRAAIEAQLARIDGAIAARIRAAARRRDVQRRTAA
jgi:hypothetical protein